MSKIINSVLKITCKAALLENRMTGKPGAKWNDVELVYYPRRKVTLCRPDSGTGMLKSCLNKECPYNADVPEEEMA